MDPRQVARDCFILHAGPKNYLSSQELVTAVLSLGFAPADSALRSAGDKVELESFISLVGSFVKPSEDEDNALYEAFRVFDKQGTGAIPAKEFVQQGQILGDGFTEEESNQMLAKAQNGAIYYQEFVKELSLK